MPWWRRVDTSPLIFGSGAFVVSGHIQKLVGVPTGHVHDQPLACTTLARQLRGGAVNVVSYHGGKVHTAMPDMPDGHAYPLCRGGGMNQMITKFRTIDAPLTCKTCLTYAERRADADSARITPTEGENVAAEDYTEATLDALDSNIERARSLAEAENEEALVELAKEHEELVSSLPARGKSPSGETWTKFKKAKRDEFKAAATVQEKPEPAPKAEVATKSYDQFEGVPELINMGAEKAVEGIQLHRKVSDTARELASITLDMWRRLPDAKNNPDVMGDSPESKAAARAMYQAVGKALAESGLDEYETESMVKKFIRSVQGQRSNVRAEYLRSLDGDDDETAEERKAYAAILADKPDDVSVARWVANYYNTGLVGQFERERLKYYQERELAIPEKYEPLVALLADEQKPEELESDTPDATLKAAVDLLENEFKKVAKLAKPETIESASDDARKAQRERLEALQEQIKEMIKATI